MFVVGLVMLAESESNLTFDAASQHVQNGLLDVHAVEHLLALAVDDLALLVHHVVVFERALAVLEVAGLDARLRVFNRLGERLVFNRRILVEVEALHQVRDALAAKQTQQIVFK